MIKSVRNTLYLSACAMAFSGYLSLATTQEYGPFILLIPMAIFALVPLAEWLDRRYPAYRRVTSAFTYAYTLAIPFFWLANGLFPTVVGLVIYIQAYKFLHQKEEHDYYHILLMSFFLLVTACVLQPEATIALAILAFLISAAWSFFALQVLAEARRCPAPCEADVVPLRQSRVTFGVPEAGPEGASQGRRAYRSRSNRFLDGHLFASYVAITLACILMTAVFFVATPRMQAGVLGGTSLQPVQQVTGLSDSVDLASGGPIEQDTSPVMRVYTPDEPGGRYEGPLYWRTTSFESFNGTGWDDARQPSLFRDGLPYMRFLNNPRHLERSSSGREGRRVHQVIYLDQRPPKGIPALPWPREVRWREGRLAWDTAKRDTTVEVLSANRESLLYEVVSQVYEPEPDALRRAPSDYLAEREGVPIVEAETFDRLTRHDLSPDVQALAREITEPYDNVYDKALALERYLSGNGFIYSLNAPMAQSGNPVDYFVLNSRQGHCELFASAMALMLRSVGIPTRVAGGYRGGEWDSGDKSYTVRQNMAHLWVEVYFLGNGWARFDPSPPELLAPTTVQARLQHYINAKALKGKMLWYQHVVGYSSQVPFRTLRTFTVDLFRGLLPSWEEESPETGGRDNVEPVFSRDAAAWILLAGLAMFGLSVIRRARRGRAAKGRAFLLNRDQLRAVRLFRSARRRLRRAVVEPEGKTAEEIAREIAATDAARAKAVRAIMDAYNDTRFGGRPMSRAQFLELQKTIRAMP